MYNMWEEISEVNLSSGFGGIPKSPLRSLQLASSIFNWSKYAWGKKGWKNRPSDKKHLLLLRWQPLWNHGGHSRYVSLRPLLCPSWSPPLGPEYENELITLSHVNSCNTVYLQRHSVMTVWTKYSPFFFCLSLTLGRSASVNTHWHCESCRWKEFKSFFLSFCWKVYNS